MLTLPSLLFTSCWIEETHGMVHERSVSRFQPAVAGWWLPVLAEFARAAVPVPFFRLTIWCLLPVEAPIIYRICGYSAGVVTILNRRVLWVLDNYSFGLEGMKP